MRTLILGLCFASAAAPALAQNTAQTIAPTDAKARVGQTVTVEGNVSDVHTGRSGTTFIDIGGRYPENALTAVIFIGDLAKFPGVKALDGRTVDINGSVQLYRGRPEIILKSAEQLRAK
jgi:exonuclease VII large subunit